MTWVAWLCGALVLVGIGYQAFVLAAMLRFFRRARRTAAPAGHTPPVTVLKPLHGRGVELFENLATFCRQDYPVQQIVFGVSDPDDPAVDVVRRIQRAFPDRDLVLSVGAAAAANGKVGTLMHMMTHARHDVLVLSDADIRVTPDYLRAMVAPLARPEVGLTTCLYRGRGPFGLPSLLESLFIDTDFVPLVMIADWIGIRTAYGASIAVKRSALDAGGGFAAAADQLADDYVVGQRIAAAGHELVVLPYVVETILDSRTLPAVWRHQLRWARTYRAVQPLGWAMAVVTQLTTWTAAFWIASGGTPAATRLAAAALGARLLALGTLMTRLGDRARWRPLWALFPKDLAVSAIWAASWLGRTVEWSGQRYRVEPDGRLRPFVRPAPLPAVSEHDPRRIASS